MDCGYGSGSSRDGSWGQRSRGRGGHRGGYRGRRGHGRGHHHGCQNEEEEGHNPRREGSGRGGANRRGRPPPGLKGRDIGMWYAARSQKQSKETELQSRTFIQMDKNKEQNITRLLSTIRAGDNVQPQPSRSYDEPGLSDSDSDSQGAGGARGGGQKGSATRVLDSRGVGDSWEDQIPVAVEPDRRENDPGTSLDHNRQHNLERSAAQGPEWSTSHTADSTESDDLMELTRDQEAGEDSDGSDCVEMEQEPATELFQPEEDIVQSEFLAELYENRKANRSSYSNVNELGEKQDMLERAPKLDEKLKQELQEKQTNRKYKQMLEFRQKLPSYEQRQEVLSVVKSNQVTVISGETGCGKTTQVSQFILDDCIQRGDGSLCRIVCTQPRRISAISVAERVADERAEACGAASVGYQIRLEARRPRDQGSILYCTTGILLQWLVSDPWLCKTSHVILDEIHERDLQSDFLMIILRDLIRTRSDLKLILMSATLNAEMFSQYFGNCPMLNIPGFTFPVTEFLLEDIVELTRYRHHDPPECRPRRPLRGKQRHCWQQKLDERKGFLSSLRGRYSSQTLKVLEGMDPNEIDIDLCAHLIDHIVRTKSDGAILVFMPGWEQIKKLHATLNNNPMYNTGRFLIIPLHSLMPTINQRQVFERPPTGVRKIIIATNIAETSITIDDVVFVVDCGKIKLKNYDAHNNISTLEAEWVSRANARQRRGRAGRVQPGECYHLYTAMQEAEFADYQLPEILRTQLEELCLQIKLLKLGRIEAFVQKAMQPPAMQNLHTAITNLQNLNALDASEELTPLGYHLAKMPVDPHTGKMLLFAAMFCCLDPVLTVAASLSFKDAFYIPMGKEHIADQRRRELSEGSQSDHIMLAKAYSGWERACSRGTSGQYCYSNFLSANTLKMLKNMRQQFAQLLHNMKFVDSSDPKDPRTNINARNEKLVKAIICAGLYPNVAMIKAGKKIHPNSKQPVPLQTVSDRKVQIHPKSVNASERQFSSSWFIYHLKMKTTNIFLYDCSVVSPYPLLFFGGKIDVRKDHGQDCIVVDDWIIFRASRRIAQLVVELRGELDKLLENKISHPGVTRWGAGHKEGALMRAILDLITTEDHGPGHGDRGHSDRGHSDRGHSSQGHSNHGHRGDRN